MPATKKPHAVEFDCNITIVMARHPDQARRYARREFGLQHEYHVREATDSEVSWVKAMDGRIHNE